MQNQDNFIDPLKYHLISYVDCNQSKIITRSADSKYIHNTEEIFKNNHNVIEI